MPLETVTPVRMTGRKPASVNETSYSPGGTPEMRKRPDASVIALIASDPRTPDFVTCTVTPGTTPLRLSVTDPAMPPAPAVAIAD